MMRATTRRLPPWLTLLLLTVVLVLPSCVLAQDQWHWELTPDPSQLATDKEEVPIMWDGKEVGRCIWAGTANTFTYNVPIDHTNGTKTDVQASWTVTGLPPTQLVPGQRIRIVGTGTASGNPESFDKRPSAESSCSQSGLLNAPPGDGGTVGFVDGKLVTAKQWVVEGTVPGVKEADRLEFFVQAGGAYATRGSLLKYVYKKVPGLAKPTVTKPEPATRPAPAMRLNLVTSKLAPKGIVAAFVVISTGLKANEKMSGDLQLTVYRDTTGAELAAMLATQRTGIPMSAGLPTESDVALASSGEEIEMRGPTKSLFSYPTFALSAPQREGEYRLEARLTTDDGGSASASVPFDVVTNPRRLNVAAISAGRATVGSACAIKLSYTIEGLKTPNAPRPRAMVSGYVQAAATQTGGGFFKSLLEQEPTLTLQGDSAATGAAWWDMVFPNPGVYRVYVQVYAPYYGTTDREATITVTGTGATVGGASNLIAAALGNRPPPELQAAGEAVGTTGGATATTAGTATGAQASQTGNGGTLGNGGGASLIALPAIGMTLTIKAAVLITTVKAGSRAALAGIKQGYQLFEIAGKDTMSLTEGQIAQYLTPQAGKEPVTLTLLDGYGNQLHVSIMMGAQ